MNLRHAKGYDLLAIAAGRQAGLKPATPETVAGDAAARAIRDDLWFEYERRLRDTQTYRLLDVWQWMKDQGAAISQSGVNRDRQALLAKERSLHLAAERAREIVAALEAGETDLLAAGRLKAGQILWEALSNFSAEALEEMTPGQWLQLMDVLGRLSTAHGQAGLQKAKLADLQRKLDEAKAEADEAAKKLLSDKGIDQKTIDRVRELYGLPKLSEVAA